MNRITNCASVKTINLSTPVGELVREFPQASRVFDRLGIDYCCGGKRSLNEACQLEKHNPKDVVAQLQTAISDHAGCGDDDFPYLSMTEMCDEIESTHHKYLKAELPRLATLLAKVRQVHGAKYAWLSDLEAAYQRLFQELVPHMFKEENILFPAIRQLDQRGPKPFFPFGSINNPIHMMEHEHRDAGDALEQIREATSEFTIPDDACNTVRALLDGLRELESDLHRHIHKENNILFPFASEKAASGQGVVLR